MLNQNHPPPIENLLEKLHDDFLPLDRIKLLVSKAFMSLVTHSDFIDSVNSEENAYEAQICLFRLLDFFDCVE